MGPIIMLFENNQKAKRIILLKYNTIVYRIIYII